MTAIVNDLERRTPTKSVCSTNLVMGLITIPVKIYKTFDELGLSGETFHDGCSKDGLSDGKIRQPTKCEEHPDLDFPATYSGIRIGNRIVPLTPEVRRSLYMGDCPFEVVSSHRLSGLANMFVDGSLHIHGNYEMCSTNQDTTFEILLDRLRIKKRFLLLSGPIGKMKRYSILLPNGRLLSLFYDEEIRAMKADHSVRIYDARSKLMDEALDKLEYDFPVLSGAEIIDRINAFFHAYESDSFIHADPSINIFTGEKVGR